ncbi:MAG: deoxyribonuclease V [Candidatus Nitrospinota bacterium M3_3B_026]
MRSEKLTPAEAVKIQKKLSRRVITAATFGKVETIAGVDVSVRGAAARAAVVMLSFPGMAPIEEAAAESPVEFPYIPGLLGFREVPVIMEAFEKLEARPDIIIVDGQGLAHPRRFGLACHLGVELDLPTIGCAKSRLVGEYREPGRRRGCKTALKYNGETIGAVLRTREGVKPVFVSVGHRVDLGAAVRLTLRAAKGFRLPEPIRAAHKAAGQWRRQP